jgi:maleate isomerase
MTPAEAGAPGVPRGPLQDVVDHLLATLAASRTTVRLDVPAWQMGVDEAAAEAVAPDVRPIRLDRTLDQRSLATVRFLDEHRRVLVQDDCRNADPAPPAELIAVYGVAAQMLAPIVLDDELVGWVSAHQTGSPRHWEPADEAVIRAAAERVRQLLVQDSAVTTAAER